MSLTPQTNATLGKIAEVILERDDFCICGHVNPDGDCMGSALALATALRQLEKKVVVLTADAGPLPDTLSFLPGASLCIPAEKFSGDCKTFIAVDVPTPERLGQAAADIHAHAEVSVTLDHHATPSRMSDFSYTDPEIASTTMIIWKLVTLLEADLDGDIATCAFTGLMTDTGGFRYQNANEEAFAAAYQMVCKGASPAQCAREVFQRVSMAALRLEALTIDHMELLNEGAAALSWVSHNEMEQIGATRSDCENLVNVLRSLDGVCVACMLREQADEVRGSLRAKDNTDVAAIARSFGGGGHRAAAGFTLHCSLSEAVDLMRERLLTLCDGEH